MVADEEGNYVPCLVPPWFPLHLVVDKPPVDAESFEADVFNVTVLVIACHDGQCWLPAVITYISESDIPDTPPGCSTVLAVVTYTQAEEAAYADVFNTDILKQYIVNKVVVATVDGKTALIIGLHFVLPQNVDVTVDDMCTSIALLRTVDVSGVFGWSPMQTYENRVSHICPECGVLHHYMMAATCKPLPSSIDGSAVIAVAAEYTVKGNVMACKYVQSITPTWM